VASPVASSMASYRNVGPLNSSNTNNNNNNNNQHHLSSVLTRDPQDYSSTKYNQQTNYKALAMPKSHYQNTTTTKEFLPTENGTSYSTASSSSSFDTESNSNANEPTKRLNNPNAKFSIQKMIRQGFSSWRTRKKPSSATTSSSSPPITSTHSNYTNTSSPPPSQPPLSAGRYMTNNDDLSQIPPPTAVRSISIDSITNKTPPQRIIVTEPVTLSSARANSVDFDRPSTTTGAYIRSPWTSSSTSTAITTTTMTTSPITTETISRPTPVPITRILPIQFAENNRISSPRSPPPSIISSPPPPSVLSTTTKTIETNNSTTPLSNIISNPYKIPPPGIYSFFINFLVK
jgi:hypothetical protein